MCDFMDILLNMKLSNKTMLYHLIPLINNKKIKHIYVVRDEPGFKLNKVIYYCPPHYVLNCNFLKFIYKQFLLISLGLFLRPDLILAYLLFPHGLMALISGLITSIKTAVVLIAGPVELYAPGDSPISIYSYTKKLPDLSIGSKIILQILNLFTYVIVAGSFTKNFLLDNGINSKKIFKIPYSIHDHKDHVIDSSKLYDLIYIGRLAKVKHVDNLLFLSKKLIKKWPSIKILILGDGPEMERLSDLSSHLGLRNNVQFKGHVSNIDPYLSKSKIFIHMSERDTGPFTVLEALKFGVPIISSKCGDMVNEVVINNYNGFLINSFSNLDAYEDAILHLLFNDDVYSKMALNSLNMFKKYTHEKIALLWDEFLSISFLMR